MSPELERQEERLGMHGCCARAARVCDGSAPQSRACAQLLASPRRARCVSRRASGEEDQHPPLAKYDRAYELGAYEGRAFEGCTERRLY